MLLFGADTALCRSFSRLLFSRRHLPNRGAVGPVQRRPSIPAAKDERGSQPCEARVAGIAQAAVERERHRIDRSARRLFLFSFSSPTPAFLGRLF
ncbi:hypothetical protein Avi_9551 (plasmid) [Allorhizobium ampelinum S4]|uniref:Uncharacterized protein n=1 Tax=Allorhizobium ampelinum (strain ATCC BAA-846 / DSM 112012 / S4) TaxID=311402 RepID=B9K348_ALLAM|nr:hypothetical protein Avi_9551 [Allorhizobium ampelinum S4]